ncbi:MAG: hypothetical protein BRC31_01910 [Actinobacteria bacterium QS_5_72_10]|nr:MAG: hypothetical protein BRC31_01910 [Actinobacteria bacterium QS_5_72_10]
MHDTSAPASRQCASIETSTATASVDELSVAVTHEHYIERGGGEHVADWLARSFGAETDVYAGLVTDGTPAEDIQATAICDGLLGRVLSHSRALRDLTYWQAWRHVPALQDYDVVVQSGNNPGWYVPPDDQTVLKYCHSPQRTPYDRWPRLSPGPLTHGYTEAARQLYAETVTTPRTIVANSELVAKRCRERWGVPFDHQRLAVVYPPVLVDEYGRAAGHDPTATEDYYFTVSRLYPSKHVDVLVDAFRQVDAQLVVAGDGPARDRLARQAPPNVRFVGYVSESEKRRRLAEARAVLFAATNEDFGMVPIEAFASGTPVVGVADGYTQHQVHQGENGLLFDREPAAVAQAVERFDREGVAWTADDLETFAEQFGVDRFQHEMRELVADAVQRRRARVVVVGAKVGGGRHQRALADGHQQPKERRAARIDPLQAADVLLSDRPAAVHGGLGLGQQLVGLHVVGQLVGVGVELVRLLEGGVGHPEGQRHSGHVAGFAGHVERLGMEPTARLGVSSVTGPPRRGVGDAVGHAALATLTARGRRGRRGCRGR